MKHKKQIKRRNEVNFHGYVDIMPQFQKLGHIVGSSPSSKSRVLRSMLYRHVEKFPAIEVDMPDVSGPMLEAIWRSEVAGSGEVNVFDCALRSKLGFGLGLGFVNGSHGDNGCEKELF
jgi:hypothetical protein